MLGEAVPDSGPVWLIVISGFVSMAAILVGVYRKFRAGEIEDSGTLNSRLETDNVNLRARLASVTAEFEAERVLRRRAEDVAAIYYRQLLVENNIQPKEVGK